MKKTFWYIEESDEKKLAEWDEDMELAPLMQRQDLRIVLPSDKINDFTFTWYAELLITNQAHQILQQEKITGYHLRPVASIKFKKKSTNPPPKLWEVVVDGWAGMIPKESGVKLIKFKKNDGGYYSVLKNPNFMIDESKWDDSDMFIVWPYVRRIFVTDKFKNVVAKHKLKGLKFIAPEEFATRSLLNKEHEVDNIKFGVGVAHLGYYFPSDIASARAKELGLPE